MRNSARRFFYVVLPAREVVGFRYRRLFRRSFGEQIINWLSHLDFAGVNSAQYTGGSEVDLRILPLKAFSEDLAKPALRVGKIGRTGIEVDKRPASDICET